MADRHGGDRRWSAWLAWALFVVGLVVVGACFLPWLETGRGNIAFSGGSVEGSATGLDLDLGIGVLVAGALTVVAALFASAGRRSKMVSSLAVLSSGAAVAIGAVVWLRVDETFATYASGQSGNTDLSSSEVRSLVERAIDKGLISVSAGVGLYAVVIAGAIGFLIAVAMLLSRSAGKADARASGF